MAEKNKGIAALAEIVAVLARYPGLRVSPVVDNEDGVVALTVCIDGDGDNGLQVLALHDELKYVADVAQLRHICATYDIRPEQLEAMLPLHDDMPPGALRHLTVAEIDAVVDALVDDMPPPRDAVALIDGAIPKLQSLARALAGAV